MTKDNRRLFMVSGCALIVVIGLVLFSASASRKTLLQQNNSSQAKPRKYSGPSQQDVAARIPTIDYDEPEPTNQEEKTKRKNKSKHYDGKYLVMKNPTNSGGGVATRSAVFDDLPALPVTQSNVILTGDVLNSEAHLSNDKTGVYSEFTFQVDTVIKGSIPTLSQTNLISISRLGGNVRYASGRTLTYGVAGQVMPATGKRYLFFLKAVDDSFEIITGYELGATVQALDLFPQFQTWTGTDSVDFLNKVRQALPNQ